MRELTTVETFQITGRGTVHIVQVGTTRDALPKLGEEILLDGRVCSVRGVEAHMTNPPKPTRDGFCGVLVSY